MYELLALALLMRWPLYAYLIADIANNIMGPWEKISRGSLSALLKKLVQAGFIEPGDAAQVPFPSTRASQVYRITKAGRERFSQVMMDTTSNPGNYQRIFHIKALHLEFVSPRDQLYLVEHYLHYCQTGARYLRAESHDLATNPMKVETASEFFLVTALDLMEVVAQEWELELDWAQRIRERIISHMHENDRTTMEENHA
jgi:DNA-binding PadR family transcriptional regulator